MVKVRTRYTPRLSPWPIVAVRWRSTPHGYGESDRAWKLYLFGLVPIAKLPRRARQVTQ